jgi:predicted RNA methylase
MSRRRRGPRSPRKPNEPEWIGLAPRGLEGLACDEVRERLGVVAMSNSPGEIRFRPEGDVDPLVLRCAELCFLRVVDLPSLPGERAGPRELLPAVERAVPDLWAAASRARSADLGRARTVRVVTRMEGSYPYPRQHLRDKAEREIPRILGGRFRRVEEGAGLELWVTAGARSLSVDVRVSPEEHRHRSYKVEHIQGSLRAAAAACLVRYARPQEDEVFCDPLCGGGTIGLERAHYGLPYAGILMGDIDPIAVATTVANVGPRHQPRLIGRWDAKRLPLGDESVDVVVTNLPFGVKIGVRDLRSLYREALSEIARVLRTNGRAVVLAEDRDLVSEAATAAERLHSGGIARVELQGRWASACRSFRY